MAVLWNFLDSLTSLMALITAVNLIITLWYLYKRASVDNLPPGPKGLPYIGVLPTLVWKNQWNVFTEWAKEYGDIVSFEVMGERTILLNDVDLVREAFSKELFSGRPSGYLIDVFSENMGILGSEGPIWKEQRRFTLSVLRDFGMGKIKAEQIIQDELTHLISAIESKNGEPFDIHPILTTAACNIIYSIVFGRRYQYDDPKITVFRDGVAQLLRDIPVMESVYSTFYWLRHVPGDIFKFRKSNEIIKNIDNIIQEEIADHKLSYRPDITRDFIDVYLHKMKKEDENSTFTEHQLMKTCFDLFIAGTEAIDITLAWSLLYLLHNPHVQTKAQADIDREIGTDARPSMKHRTSLPYIHATLNETMRYSTLSPGAVSHKNLEDCTLKGYRIPKHSVIIPNILNIHFDIRYWQNPEKFSPDRFIDENGRILKSEALIPFAVGIVGSEGPLWKEHRRFTLSVLRDFGMGKIKAEQIIQDELTHLISAIESKNWEPFDIQPILTIAVCNIIYSIVFGKRYQYDDQKITAIRDGVAELLINIPVMESVYSTLYWLRHLPGDIFKFRKSNEIIKNIDNIIQEEIADHKASYQPEITRDFVDVYLHKMKKGEENSTFTGKRSCPGESLAKMKLFIFFTGLLQTFTFLPESESNLPTAEPDVGITRVPHRFMLQAKKRF